MDKSEIVEKYAIDVSLNALKRSKPSSAGSDREKINRQLSKAAKSTTVAVRSDKENERHLLKKPSQSKQQKLDEVHKIRRNIEVMQEKLNRMLASVKNRNIKTILVEIDRGFSGSSQKFNKLEEMINNTWE